ncbi:hypothetical protein [Streptomyces longisporus]|uniref:Uncharacterized protein n=1 Tax=Streptomyces longisporus TaxID=1948 RepID=A0ABN3LYB5_STRLO
MAELTTDLPLTPAMKGKDLLVVEQHGGKYLRDGRWSVPARIELRTQLCRVTFDFSHAMTTSDVLRIETDMAHGKLVLVGSSDILIDTDGLNLTYSKLKLRSKKSVDDPRLASNSPERSCMRRSSRSGGDVPVGVRCVAKIQMSRLGSHSTITARATSSPAPPSSLR